MSVIFTHWKLYPRYPLARLGGPGLDDVEKGKILHPTGTLTEGKDITVSKVAGTKRD
jgi:hypothetical protein